MILTCRTCKGGVSVDPLGGYAHADDVPNPDHPLDLRLLRADERDMIRRRVPGLRADDCQLDAVVAAVLELASIRRRRR